MTYFFDAAGNVTFSIPERVYQGALHVNSVTVIAPFAKDTQVTAAFQLPAGEKTQQMYLEFEGAAAKEETGQAQKLYIWRTYLPQSVTQNFGNVTAQIFCTSPQGEILATEPVCFTVERGIAPELPAEPEEDLYRQILGAIAQIGADVNSASYAARALFAWREDVSYTTNEIVFCPQAYEHGSFVRSLLWENSQPPYDESGVLNAEAWEEVCRFDTVFEQAEQARQASVSAAESAQTAQQAKESIVSDASATHGNKEDCLRYAQEAKQSADDALKSAKEAQEAVKDATAIAGGDFALRSDVEELIDGTVSVANAQTADAAQEAVKAERDALGNVIDAVYATKTECGQSVRYSDQTLTSEQQAQARENIGAIDSEGTVANALKLNNEENIVVGKDAVSSLQPQKTYINCSFVGVTLSEVGEYYFIHCSGTIILGNASVKVYATHSPDLVVNGITQENWQNVYRDGEASYVVLNSTFTLTKNTAAGTQIVGFSSELHDNILVEIAYRGIVSGFGYAGYKVCTQKGISNRTTLYADVSRRTGDGALDENRAAVNLSISPDGIFANMVLFNSPEEDNWSIEISKIELKRRLNG